MFQLREKLPHCGPFFYKIWTEMAAAGTLRVHVAQKCLQIQDRACYDFIFSVKINSGVQYPAPMSTALSNCSAFWDLGHLMEAAFFFTCCIAIVAVRVE